MKTTKTRIIRKYSELKRLETFEERFEYLKLGARVGSETFGFDRYLNQRFYKTDEWKTLRNEVIVRDLGCDLGIEGYDIQGKIYIHHMNPITQDDILNHSDFLIDPEYLITTTLDTHNAIHYGDSNLIRSGPIERKPYDTCPWLQNRRT